MQILKAMAGLVATAAIVGATAPAANAVYTNSDPLYDQKSYFQAPSLATKAQVDITRWQYWRTTGRIYFRVTVRDLTSGVRLPDLLIMEDRPSDQYRYQIYYTPGHVAQLLLGVGNTGNEKCSGQGWAGHDYTANWMQVSFPRSCFLKDHEWKKPIVRTKFDNGSSTYHVQVVDWSYGAYSIVPNP